MRAFEPLLDWLTGQNDSSTSRLYGQVDMEQMVLGGHSRGGKLAALLFAGGCGCGDGWGGLGWGGGLGVGRWRGWECFGIKNSTAAPGGWFLLRRHAQPIAPYAAEVCMGVSRPQQLLAGSPFVKAAALVDATHTTRFTPSHPPTPDHPLQRTPL